MDFSSLDLLASTALRDNSPTQADTDTTPADTHQPQHNHHGSVENDEDDEEADDNSVKETSEADSTEVGDLVQEGDMGSVKCGKHKKNSANAKPMSIFVRNGKCVAKHLSTDVQPGHVKPMGGEVVTGDCKKTGVAHKATPEQEGNSGGQNIAVDSTGSVSPKCSQPMEVDTQKIDSPAQPSFIGIVTHRCQTTVSAVTEDRAETSQQRANPNAEAAVFATRDSKSVSCIAKASQKPGYEQEEHCGQLAEKDCDTVHVLAAASPIPTAAAPTCQGDERPSREQPEKQSKDGDCSHTDASGAGDDTSGTGAGDSDSQSSVLHADTDKSLGVLKSPQDQINDSDMVPSDCASCSALNGTNPQQNVNNSDKISSDRVNFSVPDGKKSLCSLLKNAESATETRTPNICDEDLTVMYSCSRTEKKAGRQNSPCKNSLDQEIGSLGNKESQSSSTSTKSDDVKTVLSPPPPPTPSSVIALLDHTYCSRSKKLLEHTDDSGDAFESADENISADETERRPRSLSVDSVYLQYNLAGLPSQQDVLSSQNDKQALISPTLSVDSNDSSLSEHSMAGQSQSYSILVGSPTPKLKGTSSRPNLAFTDSRGKLAADGVCRLGSSMLEADTSLLDSSSVMAAGPKCGKFRIGTYGSFSNSHLELEKDCKKSKLKNGLAPDPLVKGPMSSPAVASPGSPFPLLQSPGMEWDRSDAGSEAPDDLDSTTTEDKFLSSSHDSEKLGIDVRVWNHPVYHDHDYCSKEVSEEYLGKPAAPVPPVKTGKRKYVKKKDRQESEEEKLKKGKYLKRELLKQDNRFNLGAGRSAESRAVAARSSHLAESLTTKPNPVGRPRKRTEKQVEEYDAETGTKMKITGKYQDQYVYYLNKSSRNRRRKVDEKLTSGDKIILPAPKPGDIVVPHLSDADCEAIRRGGRMALLNSPHPSGSSVSPHTDCGDMDSSIVNTILSMETEHGNLHSPLSAYDEVGSATEDFADDIEGNLTSEQVKMLFDCLEDCQMEETTIGQELDLFTSAESVSVPSTTVDSLAATSVEADMMVPDMTQHPTGITAPSASLMGKVDPSSPVQGKLEQESLTCSMKRELGAEPKPLVGGLSVPPTSQPSVEKNLEFLKTPFFPEVSVASTGSHGLFAPAPPTSMLSPLHDSKSDDVNETPWIVTVTLYFNDIPAIVINNAPHVRLVDIHRQILPAKDTGILKKRCQLMNIQVSNCSEMQRYFLVQYGRAHNSKSTLVISKDEAQRLITYYAHPPPRNLRGEEGGPGGLRRSSSYAELRSMDRPPTNPPATRSSLAFNQPRKRGGFRRRPLPTTRSDNPSPEPLVSPSVTTPSLMEPIMTPTLLPQPATPSSPAKGLRHKKINFREMLKGEDCSSQPSSLADGVADEDPAIVVDAPVAKGRAPKAPTTAAGGKKRRGSKEAGGGPPAKRGRKAWRKKTEGKDGLPEVAKKLTVEDRGSSLSSAKSKKRSPGSAANGGTLTASGRSPKSKYGPIKVNVKSLVSSGVSLSSDGTQPRKKNLFGRKSSGSTDTVVVVDESDREAAPLRGSSSPLRVLRISRQDVEASTPPTPQIHHSPSGEVHMDLYKRSSSACVKCGTCHKFLSVGDFLRHQHVDGEEVIGSTAPVADDPSHQRRILVPMNKENISLEEQRLWNEFVVLQESLDRELGAGMAFPLTPLSPEASPVSSSLNMFGEACSPGVDDSSSLMTMTPESPHTACLHNGHDDFGLEADAAPRAVAVMAEKLVAPDNEPCVASHPSGDPSLSAVWDSQLSISSSPSFPLFPTTHTQNEEKCIDNDLDSNDKEIQSVDPKTIAPHNKKKQWAFQQPKRVSPTTSIRTSSRKRETKRLYSFEKYEFGVGGKKGGRAEVDTQDSEDDLAALLDNVDVAMSNTVLHFATALQEPQNA